MPWAWRRPPLYMVCASRLLNTRPRRTPPPPPPPPSPRARQIAPAVGRTLKYTRTGQRRGVIHCAMYLFNFGDLHLPAPCPSETTSLAHSKNTKPHEAISINKFVYHHSLGIAVRFFMCLAEENNCVERTVTTFVEHVVVNHKNVCSWKLWSIEHLSTFLVPNKVSRHS